MCVIFQKKSKKRVKNVKKDKIKGKILESLGENAQNLKIFRKRAGDNHRQLTAKALATVMQLLNM